MLVTLRFFKTREGAGTLAIIGTSVLFFMKLAAGIVTGSAAIRADAIHSLVDLTGAIIGMIGIRVAARPPDRSHAFGHGKAENLAGAIIGFFILLAGGIIAYEAVNRLIHGSAVGMVSAGIAVTCVAILLNLSISWYGLRVARQTDSIALEATSRDLLADSLSSVAVLIGLVLVAVTGNVVFDSVVALIVSLVILRTGAKTAYKSAAGLMDNRLPAEEEKVIQDCLSKHREIVDFHKLRTRKAGSERFIDLHVLVPGRYTVSRAHAMCDEIETEIKSKLPHSRLTIHIEPSGKV